MKKMKRFTSAAMIALMLSFAAPRVANADAFYNCVTYWYVEVCYWLDSEDPYSSYYDPHSHWFYNLICEASFGLLC